MIRQSKNDPSQAAKRVRDEVTAAREHLLAAAEQGVQRLGDSSRRTRKTAEERTRLAARVLRGEHPERSPWRWLGLGLAAGVAAGAAAMAALRRWQGPASEAVREKAGPTVDSVRERTTAVANRAAEAARETAAKVRGSARDVAEHARDQADEVSAEARGQAQEVAKDAKANAKGVAEDARQPATANATRGKPKQDPAPGRPAGGGSAQ